MGDFMAMNSISHWDENKRITMEGRRYKEEIAAGNRALSLLEAPLSALQKKQKEQKVKIYHPKKVFLEGNHESWVHKYVEDNPSLEGHIDITKDLNLEKRGWQFVSYRKYFEIKDILFTHVPIDGANQPIKGVNTCQTAARYVAKSCVFGHTHRLESSNIQREGANLIHILTCGCFFDKEDKEFGANTWRGVVLLDVWAPGRFDKREISLERLTEQFTMS